jgi:hypothetical protein
MKKLVKASQLAIYSTKILPNNYSKCDSNEKGNDCAYSIETHKKRLKGGALGMIKLKKQKTAKAMDKNYMIQCDCACSFE